jgi:hypothetical protein
MAKHWQLLMLSGSLCGAFGMVYTIQMASQLTSLMKNWHRKGLFGNFPKVVGKRTVNNMRLE